MSKIQPERVIWVIERQQRDGRWKMLKVASGERNARGTARLWKRYFKNREYRAWPYVAKEEK